MPAVATDKPVFDRGRRQANDNDPAALFDRPDVEEAEAVLHQLDAFGWLDPVPTIRRDSKEWNVDPRVYDLFEDKADEESERRAGVRETIARTARLHTA